MINLSNYSCDKCDREFSRHCKHCYHTAEKPPTRFKPKKKTGVQTPEFRKPSAPPPSPTSGSNAVRPNPNYVPPASVKKSCPYELPCGWCTKWDKKCDKKIGCYPTVSEKVQKKTVFETQKCSPCSNCAENEKIFSLCAECGGAPDYKYFKQKEN
jgi:hypothetical protein